MKKLLICLVFWTFPLFPQNVQVGSGVTLGFGSIPNPLSTSAIEDKGGQVFNVKAYGAKGDGKWLFDGSVSGSTLTSATGPFSAADVSKPICVSGATTQSCGNISAYTSATQVTLSFSMSAASSLPFVYGTDDTTAINSALTAAETGNVGGTIYFPDGTYILTSSLTVPDDIPIVLKGAGSGIWNAAPSGVSGFASPNAVGGSRLVWATKLLSSAALSVGSSSTFTSITAIDKIEDISLFGGAGNHRDGGGSDGLEVINWQNFSAKDVHVGNFSGNGVYLDGVGTAGHYLEAISFDQLYSFWNGGYGLKIGSSSNPRLLETIGVMNSVIENNGGAAIGFIGNAIDGFNLVNSVIQWNNVSAAGPELFWAGAGSVVQGCQIRGDYFEIDSFAGSKSNALATANLPCDFGTNYTQGDSAKFVRNDNQGNIIIPTGIRSGVATNTDLAGQITLSSGTGSYTFTGTYTSAPICTASDTTAANAVQVATTTTTLTLTGTGSDVINYTCVGRN